MSDKWEMPSDDEIVFMLTEVDLAQITTHAFLFPHNFLIRVIRSGLSRHAEPAIRALEADNAHLWSKYLEMCDRKNVEIIALRAERREEER